ncbi:MAG: DUF2326 domain-containing protein [Pirellulales bacterium]
MRLKSLTANQPTFRPVNFNATGVSLIVGAQKDKTDKSTSRTYNGVGKSLLVALLHFCLGANRNKELESKLPEWQFILHFEHEGKDYRVSRATSKQTIFNVNGDELKTKEYRDLIGSGVFPSATGVKQLSFRNVVRNFIRPRASSYISYSEVDKHDTPFDNLLRNSFLLGLNTSLVLAKHDLKLEKDKVKEQRDSLCKDNVFREYFTGNKDPDIELRDLELRIANLQTSKAQFRVADDYYEKQCEADEVQRTVQKVRNSTVVLRNAIRDIDKSLVIHPDLAPSDIASVYAEANAALPEKVIKTLKQVCDFHARLLDTRVARLSAEKQRLEAEITALEATLAQQSQLLDGLMHYLGTHGAFDEFVKLSDELASLETNAQKLRDYKGLLEKYSNKTQELTAALSSQTIKANNYLKDAKPLLDSNLDVFRGFSSQFYGEKPGGLTVSNNEGDNQVRFDIKARIEDDAADGINEVKLFCYDMTVLTQRHGHLMDFLVHDSRLFGGIDKRQRATLFKIAHEIAVRRGMQYITTINEDLIDAMRDQFTDEEFSECIEKATVLKLTDDSPIGKLLGIQVDMHYEDDEA